MSLTYPRGFVFIASLLATFLLLPTSSVRADVCPATGKVCRMKVNCHLPDCNCVSEEPPVVMDPVQVPQLVVFAFSGPLNNDSWYHLRRIFDYRGKGSKKRLNPNDEPITMTLFVSDDGTDHYCRAGEFYRHGHEIGVAGTNSSWSMASRKPRAWEAAMMGQRANLTKEAKIDEEDIRGMRAPSLQAGGDQQFVGIQYMSNETRYKAHVWRPYDSSIAIGEKNVVPLWPYTMDFRVSDVVRPQNRHPVACYPGVWEVPVQRFYDNYSSAHDFIDDWDSAENVEMLYYTIANNFWRHYSTNRAPFVINARTYWFSRDPYALEAIERFIDVLLAHTVKDVYVVSMEQVVEWTKHPLRLDEIKASALFKQPTGRKGLMCNMADLNWRGNANGNVMLLIEGGVLLVLLVVLIARDRSED
ncbi:hypothetical protein NP493_459g01047 [Ridgeia piscesae]|uniref:Uncharacterized protein n=1 Tax=Ridgeia piscesae TaxID=27915 RepID=A0AAD9KZ71_RIDPI|nr:hypothetical protein NP493_459g01047 [Ridgeia piscesae]